MLVLYYFNWAGTSEELKEFAGRVGDKANATEGVEFLGIFAPSSEWNYSDYKCKRESSLNLDGLCRLHWKKKQ